MVPYGGQVFFFANEVIKLVKMKPPVEKNEYYNVTFEDLTHEGAGVAKIEGFPVFVPNALPDEQGQIKVTRVKKKDLLLDDSWS
ncbi:hypothetical protein BsIDN1_12860 [Bacillus safensis]|uniref:TRAM domain-containing protein n=1 Tax=Bacillus safensis TaxID=561879 RepID=A0A5S9M4G0_BACIA|nr:hypothetical protein BsIDN1_12860 [Bacillus safensis]